MSNFDENRQNIEKVLPIFTTPSLPYPYPIDLKSNIHKGEIHIKKRFKPNICKSVPRSVFPGTYTIRRSAAKV